jgi:hypothetical protein
VLKTTSLGWVAGHMLSKQRRAWSRSIAIGSVDTKGCVRYYEAHVILQKLVRTIAASCQSKQSVVGGG